MSLVSIFKNNPEDITALIDIGSGSVGAALVIFPKNKKPEIIFSKRLSLRIEESWNKEKVFSSILLNLEQVLNHVLKEGAGKLHIKEKNLKDKKIKDIYCILSSPWSTFKVKTLEDKKERAEYITDTAIETIVRNDLQSSNQNSEYESIEKKIIQVKLNGYPTSNPLGKRARETEISIFEGLVKREVLEKIKRVIGKNLHGNVIFHSLSLATFTAINEIFREDKDYLVVDITGETTEMIFVSHDLPKKSFSFPKGKNNLIRNIAKEFNVDQDIALSFTKLYYEKKSEESFRNKAEQIIKKTEMEWQNDMEQVLDSVRKEIPVLRVFSLVDPELAYPFPELIKSACQKIFQDTLITSINKDSLDKFCNFKEKFDPFLAIGAISVKNTKIN